MKKPISFLRKLIVPILIVVVWSLFTSGGNAPVYLPSLLSISEELASLIVTDTFIDHIAITLYRCFVGFLIAALIAVPVGMSLGFYKKVMNLFQFVIEFLRPLPSAAVIPIAILFLGIGDSMKIFVIVFGSTWPILINTLDGVLGIEKQYLKTAKVFNVSSRKTLLKVVFPSILPQIFSGFKVSIAISLILAITVEMIVGGNGLGFFILDAERSFQFTQMYAGVFTIGILGYLINIVFIKLEKWIIFWK
ncbi:MAG: ABC transporter permease [Cyclobacteriaceae bacterium]